MQLLEQYQVDYNVVTVVTNDTAKQASFLYKFWKRNHYPFVQFIPCMDEIKRQDGTQERSIYAVESEQYGKFLCELFDLWYADFAAGEAMNIRMFSNLAQMAAGYPAEECGMNGCCNCYFVVEGDGSVYPCDFYCMDEWKLGTVNDGFVQMKTSEKSKKHLWRLPDRSVQPVMNVRIFSVQRRLPQMARAVCGWKAGAESVVFCIPDVFCAYGRTHGKAGRIYPAEICGKWKIEKYLT